MKTVKVLRNICDSETSIVHLEGDELNIAKEKADRWIESGHVVEVKTVATKSLPTPPSNKAEKEFN